jgi:hypothetical protein
MKVSTEIDNNFGYEKITQLVDNIPLNTYIPGGVKIYCEPLQGRIQDFKLGGAHLKKIAPRGGRRENFWGISCKKKHDFTPKNHIFSYCGGRREHFWGISCEKSRFYAKKSYFFQF